MTNGARFILEAIKSEGIDTVFLVPGGLIDPMLPEFEHAGVRAVVAAHEAGAAFMADGYARATGGIGVCMCIGGPGIANMVGPLSAAFADRSPVLAICGEVPSDWEGRGAFQDASAGGLNDLEMVRPITRFALEVGTIDALRHDLRRAIHSMVGVVRRPAFLSVPRQLQVAEIDTPYGVPTKWAAEPPRILDESAAAELAAALEGKTRIAVLAGNGTDLSGAAGELRQVAERFSIPVATTLRAKGVLPEDHPMSLGVFGYAGTRRSIEALLGEGVEALLVLGSTLNQRDTMVWNQNLHSNKKLIQVDIDPTSFGQNYDVDTIVCSDIRTVLRWLLEDRPVSERLDATAGARADWMRELCRTPRVYDGENLESEAVPIHPARAVSELRKAAPRDTVMLVDSGAHRAFAGHYWEAHAPRHYLTSTTMAPMGWAIPAALGAKLARPDLPTAVITGDGCMLMHGIEIQSAAHHRVPIVFVVFNNHALGNVYLRARQQSESAGALTLLGNHDWAGFARSLGAEGERVDSPGELCAAFERAFESEGPYLVDVRCDPLAATPVTPWNEAKHEWLDQH